jgi:hypothetical protein
VVFVLSAGAAVLAGEGAGATQKPKTYVRRRFTRRSTVPANSARALTIA